MISYGLIGTNGAGKSAVCNYFKQKGFAVISLSDIVREEASRRNFEHTRDNMVTVANDLKNTKGMAYLAEQVIEKSRRENIERVVFDSIRNLKEVLLLKKNGTLMIGVDADPKIRYQRIQARNRASDHIDFETFIKHDERENKGISSGQNINESLSACDIIIKNEGSLDALHAEVDQFIASLQE